MKKLMLLLTLVAGTAFAGADTAPAALKALPPLPGAAAKDLDCSHGATLHQKVDEKTRREMVAAQAEAANASAMMTPEQMQALQALTDPAFSTCPIEVMQLEATGWGMEPEQKLAARLAEITQAKAKHDQEYCEKHSKSAICEPDPSSAKRFNAQTVAAGTQYLKDMQPGYAKLLKQAGDCIALRDPSVRASQGIKGAMAGLAVGADAQNWGLVVVVADARSNACAKARDAARTYLDMQSP